MDKTTFTLSLDTEERKAKVEELRSLVSGHTSDPEKLTDTFLIRWLVVKEWDVAVAAEMFIKSMNWRKENDPETLHKTWPVENKELWNHLNNVYWPGGLIGKTKDGWLLYCESIGKLDAAGIVDKLDANSRTSYQIWKLEENEAKRREIEREKGGNVTAGITVILDLTGLSWKHMSSTALAYFKEVTLISRSNYPEALRKMYIINPPSLFAIMWKIITPMLDASTLAKTQILGSNYLDIISEQVDVNLLPSNLGGKGKELPAGGPFYKPGEKQNLAEEDEWEHDTVPRSGVFEKIINVTERNSTILWEFSTEDNDLAFGIYYEKDGERIEELPVKKYESHLEVIRDLIVANKTGNYILSWDNQYSWTKRKFLQYHYNVISPLHNK